MLNRHRFALLAAVIIGFLYLMPQLFFIFSLGDKFQGVYREINDDERYYMARARDIVDGHYLLSNPYFVEHKSGEPMQVFLSDLLAAWPARIFHFDVYPLYLFYDFLWPAVLFFLTYFIFYRLIKNKFWSIFFSLFIFLIKYFFVFNRPINPQFVFVFALTLVLLLLLILTAEKKAGPKRADLSVVLAGLNFGLLFYFYVYFWTYFIVVFSLLIFYFLYKRDFYFLKKILSVGLIGLAVAVPYFYQFWRSSQSDFFLETLQRIGLLNTRLPSGLETTALALLVMILFVFYWRFGRRRENGIPSVEAFLFIGAASAAISMNQHVITGRNALSASHYDLISYFFIVFALVYLVWQIKKIVRFLDFKFIKVVFLLALVGFFIPIIAKGFKFDYPGGVNQQRFGPLFVWLNENTPKDSVVMADAELSSLIPSYAHNNIFFDFGGVLFFISDQEALDRFVVNNFWYKNFNEEFVKANFNSVYGYQYDAQGGRAKQKNKLKKIFGWAGQDLEKIYYPPEKVEAVLNHYQDWRRKDWPEAFKNYQIDYLVINELSDSDWAPDPQNFRFLRLVKEINKIKIYQITLIYF
ncbi:MAG: hypothetical protein WC610_04035 [Patescibacteria group bacterium]